MMHYAVTLPITNNDARKFTAIWEELAWKGVSEAQLKLQHPPHIGLAAYNSEQVDFDKIQRACVRVAKVHKALSVTFREIAVIFNGAASTLLAHPNRIDDLFRLQAKAFVGNAARPHDNPKVWNGYVTMARNLMEDQVGPALGIVRGLWKPLETRLDQITIDEVRSEGEPKVKTVWRMHLRL